MQILRLYHLEKLRFVEIFADVDNVDPVAVKARKNQLVPALVRAAEAAAACVPVHMVEFVSFVGHGEPVNNLHKEVGTIGRYWQKKKL